MYKVRENTCEYCGKKFKTQKPNQRFCSVDCANKSHAGELHHNYTEPVEKICEHCGNNYYVIPSRADLSHYCSVECKNSSQVIEREIKQCRLCGKDYVEYEGSLGICKRKNCQERAGVYIGDEFDFPQLGIEPTERICPVCGRPYFGQLSVCDSICHENIYRSDRKLFNQVQDEINYYRNKLQEIGKLAPMQKLPLGWD